MTQVNHFWKLVSKATVDDWKGMNGDHDFIALAVDADGVIVVLIGLVASGGKLHVDVLGNSSRQHSFFVVPDLEEWRLGRQDVQPLRSRRVVDDFDFQSVGFVGFKAGKFQHCRTCLEDSVASNCVKDVICRYRVCLPWLRHC